MTWSEENYIATYFPEFPTFIRKAKKKEVNLSRESEKSENGMRSFVSVSEQENEADIKV